jgi:mannose-1-phosphate guanylyltransferase
MMMDYPTSRMNVCRQRSEWAVILAGGDGTRLRSLTRQIAGDERPKQFCSVLGKRTLLEETQGRVALEIAHERTLYVVNRLHEPYYGQIFRGEPAANLVVQPSNRGTAPAILYSLMRIATIDPEALVVFFPSDHYISDDQKFMSHIRSALNAASHRPNLVILLGLDPETPEVEYGWIEPSEPIQRQSNIYAVRRFWEKPNQLLAQVLQLRGCLWNSFVMVASVQTLLKMMESAVPHLYNSFVRLAAFLGTPHEPKLIGTLYKHLIEVNFSHQVLVHRSERLAVLKVTGVRWNDLGEPRRVMASLNMAGIRPHWAAAAPQFA